jgi:hypothetical protein
MYQNHAKPTNCRLKSEEEQCTCTVPVHMEAGSVVEHEVSCNAHTCVFWMFLEKGCNVLVHDILLQTAIIIRKILYVHL